MSNRSEPNGPETAESCQANPGKKAAAQARLALPGLERAKTAVQNSLTSTSRSAVHHPGVRCVAFVIL